MTERSLPFPLHGSEREMIDTGTDKRYVRRKDDGTFKESDDMGRSPSQDVGRMPRRLGPTPLARPFRQRLETMVHAL